MTAPGRHSPEALRDSVIKIDATSPVDRWKTDRRTVAAPRRSGKRRTALWSGIALIALAIVVGMTATLNLLGTAILAILALSFAFFVGFLFLALLFKSI